MSAGVEPTSSKAPRFVIGAIAFLSALFVVGLGALIFYMVRPRGQEVGSVSLTEPHAQLGVNAASGDALLFRVDASIARPRLSLESDDQVERAASRQLTRSTLTVRATAPSGRQLSSSCAVYKGRALSTTSTSGSFARSGMLNDCSIAIDEAGQWKVAGSVAWASDVTLQSASLEARLDAGSAPAP